jgi:hypothetical protein
MAGLGQLVGRCFALRKRVRDRSAAAGASPRCARGYKHRQRRVASLAAGTKPCCCATWPDDGQEGTEQTFQET